MPLRIQGTAPTIAVDNTNGCQLYLGRSSLDAAITTAKSSAINVLVPGPTDDSDPVSRKNPTVILLHYRVVNILLGIPFTAPSSCVHLFLF